jgi:hypothetical protein
VHLAQVRAFQWVPCLNNGIWCVLSGAWLCHSSLTTISVVVRVACVQQRGGFLSLCLYSRSVFIMMQPGRDLDAIVSAQHWLAGHSISVLLAMSSFCAHKGYTLNISKRYRRINAARACSLQLQCSSIPTSLEAVLI